MVASRIILSTLVAAFAVAVINCTASETTLQGAEGEYCNGDDLDCRAPLLCVDYVCTYSDEVYWEECSDICDRVDDCNVVIDDCLSSCVNSTYQWSEEAVELFRACFVDDLECQQLQESENPPQTCYSQLPLAEDRAERCRLFVDAARSCGADDDEASHLRSRCRFMGRTRSAEVWAYSDECVHRIADGVCQDIYACFDETLDLDPPLGDGSHETDANDDNGEVTNDDGVEEVNDQGT